MSALILALAAGAAVGLALGALGGGGSVLAVPALIYLLGFTPAAATTASLLIVAATSATALYAHARSGNVRWRTGALFAASGLLPAAAAGAAAAHLPQRALTAAFAAIATLAAVTMLLATRKRPAGERPADDERAGAPERPQGQGRDQEPEPPRRAPAGVKAAGTGAGLGALTGLLGVGGGFLVVPTLVTVLAFEMQAAVGTSLLVITTNSLASLATRGATASGLDWSVIAPFAATAILGAWDGKRLAAKVSGTVLRRTFAVALLGVAAFMLVDALT
ncbi:sulfite exporter TauE/SafE family protein [Streptomyces sp. UNOB3_S3]|uniref:sulfite exporter TauE/SafE family protein n=1 Tax=Streptomyces sp. UNOB3_S3 TaxID=2871682 RepID=UPI001E3847F5|nr:sulfite exporter TauE/SafE family protein [Streptomyces sp. UNOB3_S3]MCC3777676.1 sulfite exporter TauE/SafE family protein [Streptomyces sp. UNOB3_S3]